EQTERRVGFAAVLRPVDRMTCLAQRPLQPGRKGCVVFRDEDAHRALPARFRRSSHEASQAKRGSTLFGSREYVAHLRSANQSRGPCAADRASKRMLELLENRRIFQGRYVLRDRFALCDRAQQAPHDLTRPRLGKVVTEADVLWLG